MSRFPMQPMNHTTPNNVTTITDGQVDIETDLVYQGTRRTFPREPHKVIQWTLFTTTICDGYIPSTVDSEEGEPDRWAYYDTLREAQIECLDELSEQAHQVIAGERDVEDSDLCGYDPQLVLTWIAEFIAGTRTWESLTEWIQPNLLPEEVEPTDDGGFIFNGKQLPCPDDADFR